MVDSIVAFVLKSTANWGRNVIVKRLRDGDAFDQMLCNAIEGEFSTIRRNLDAIARTDLLDSIDYFNDGIGSISQAGASEEDGPNSSDASEDEGPPPKKSKIEVGPQIEAVDGKMIKDKANFSTTTKKRFKEARKAAGSALNNEALKVEERILAANIKVLAQLLEKEDSTTVAFGFCINNLTKLNSLKDVSKKLDIEITALRRRLSFERLLSSPKGRDIIWCVCRLNRFVFDMAQEVGVAAESQKLFIWPCIEIGKRKQEIDPLRDRRLDKIFDKEERESCSVIWSFGQECAEEQHKLKLPRRIVANAQEQFLVVDGMETKVFDNSGRYLKSLPLSTDINTQYHAVDVDTDQSGNVYVLVSTTDGQHGEVHVFDKDGKAKLDDNFQLTGKKYKECKLAVTQSEVLVLKRKSGHQNAKIEVYETKNGMFQFASHFEESNLMDAQDIVWWGATRGHIFVLDKGHPASKTKYIHEFSKTSHRHLRRFEVAFNSVAIAFHRASEHLVIASTSEDNLLLSLCTTDGKAKREYKLHETGLVSNPSPSITVTAKGRIVVALTQRLGHGHQGKVIVY